MKNKKVIREVNSSSSNTVFRFYRPSDKKLVGAMYYYSEGDEISIVWQKECSLSRIERLLESLKFVKFLMS